MRATLIFLSLWWAVGASAASSPAPSDDELRALHGLVSDWQIETARLRLAKWRASAPDDPGVRFVQARVLYFQGRYADSLAEIDALIKEAGEAPPSIQAFRDRVESTRDALKGFDEIESPDGRFLVRFKGVDRLVVPYVIDVLTAADKVLSEDFAYRPPEQVVVEIYPEIKYLAAVSPLTESEIETSGTIALCKYNRLMFTSPRALARGYEWRDTVSHEFVHYYVTKVSANTVPIWLHEGLAKFQETRWRAAPGLGLDPPQEDLLARSLKSDKLVTFDQMHPSMAKLPSQEAASLAFAEVHTVIGFMHRKTGYPGLRKLLARLKAGDKMDAALRSASGYTMSTLWTAWKRDAKKLGLKTYPGLVQTSLEFKRPGESAAEAEKKAGYVDIKDKRVKDFAHLGELLRARGRHKAALVEYRKAIALGGDGNPMVQNGAADSMLALDKHAEVPEALERVLSYYPGYLGTRLNLGDALLRLGREDEAIVAFEAAVGINPFHPRPHQALAALYEKAGRTADAARETQSLELLK